MIRWPAGNSQTLQQVSADLESQRQELSEPQDRVTLIIAAALVGAQLVSQSKGILAIPTADIKPAQVEDLADEVLAQVYERYGIQAGFHSKFWPTLPADEAPESYRGPGVRLSYSIQLWS